MRKSKRSQSEDQSGQKISRTEQGQSVLNAKRNATCSECGYVGPVGEVVPYSFAKGDIRWLCWAGTGKDCFVKAWDKFRASRLAVRVTDSELEELNRNAQARGEPPLKTL